ncbi:hypothetical protein N018_11970 [Pseudomonas syringae CC1557]|uniref:Uncharacterized protein n=1 Tax=Pseudomonas syringae CC1557 TaxID=1357279 RepID=W0N2Q9_PSESX|nr:hypothetical protein N018_11970 [Pseudomonas syringae CC1557]
MSQYHLSQKAAIMPVLISTFLPGEKLLRFTRAVMTAHCLFIHFVRY